MCENSKWKGRGGGGKSDLIFVHAQHRKKLHRVVQLDNPMQCEMARDRERERKEMQKRQQKRLNQEKKAAKTVSSEISSWTITRKKKKIIDTRWVDSD